MRGPVNEPYFDPAGGLFQLPRVISYGVKEIALRFASRTGVMLWDVGLKMAVLGGIPLVGPGSTLVTCGELFRDESEDFQPVVFRPSEEV